MPTGYTAKVATGEITELKDFALTCARGMGALIMMRDEPASAPIPERFEPSPYYKDEADKAEAELAKLMAMSEQEAQAAADAALADTIAQNEKWLADKATQRERYDAMIAKVRAWEGAPEGIKGFMLEQLTESRKWDCPEKDYLPEPVAQSGAEWRAYQIKTLGERLSRYRDEHGKEVKRTEDRNAWIAQLRKSLAEIETA